MNLTNQSINKHGFKFLDNDKTNLNNFINDVKKLLKGFLLMKKNLKVYLIMILIR